VLSSPSACKSSSSSPTLSSSKSLETQFCRKIDEGRNQQRCLIDFQGHLVSAGIGHNKSEAKKDAAANALKLVAPTVFEEILKDYVSPCDTSSKGKLIGQKRVEAPTPELSQSLLEEEDSAIRLSHPLILKKKTLFKQYSTFMVKLLH